MEKSVESIFCKTITFSVWPSSWQYQVIHEIYVDFNFFPLKHETNMSTIGFPPVLIALFNM